MVPPPTSRTASRATRSSELRSTLPVQRDRAGGVQAPHIVDPHAGVEAETWQDGQRPPLRFTPKDDQEYLRRGYWFSY
ncbi:unnamed protein product [Arctia plantaginis]|uniref:Uncharacterized protein n=1 Tax=Arctia plantaginis TaxID=874455 RepID=A0A8S0Z3Q8_ARCPL|nr:unnamed protein product [Arctia plantaginis]